MGTQQATKGLNENAGMAVNRQRGRRVKLRATLTTLKFPSSPPECLRTDVCLSECASRICIAMIAISACQMLGKIYSACLIYQPSPLPLWTLCIVRASSSPFPASPPAFLPFFSFFVTFSSQFPPSPSLFSSLPLPALLRPRFFSFFFLLLNGGTRACARDIRQMDFLHVIKVTLAELCWEILVVLFKLTHKLH